MGIKLIELWNSKLNNLVRLIKKINYLPYFPCIFFILSHLFPLLLPSGSTCNMTSVCKADVCKHGGTCNDKGDGTYTCTCTSKCGDFRSYVKGGSGKSWVIIKKGVPLRSYIFLVYIFLGVCKYVVPQIKTIFHL